MSNITHHSIIIGTLKIACLLPAGVSDVALELADQAVTIPMTGFVDSFNVSVAAGMCLWDARSARVRHLGQHGDLDATQQRTLAAAMLLRHKVVACW